MSDHDCAHYRVKVNPLLLMERLRLRLVATLRGQLYCPQQFVQLSKCDAIAWKKSLAVVSRRPLPKPTLSHINPCGFHVF